MNHENQPENNSGAEEVVELLRQAAAAGPGHRGQRVTLAGEDRGAIAKRLDELGVPAPAYLGPATEWVERRAKLFEAGDYPDKGVTVTPEHLDALDKTFDLPVPVLIEHAQSPLELGYLTDVRAADGELFGTIALTREANELINRSGAHALSLGLSRELDAIREVSLVRNPRVESARLFTSQTVQFHATLPATPRPDPEADRAIDDLVREGKLVPAQTPFAKALMRCPDVIEFDGDEMPVRQLILAMLERSVPHALFAELAPVGPAAEASNLPPEEAAFYRRHFPDLSLEEIALRRKQRR